MNRKVLLNLGKADPRSLKRLTHKVPNTTLTEFAKNVDPDETAHNELSYQDLQCLPSSL